MPSALPPGTSLATLAGVSELDDELARMLAEKAERDARKKARAEKRAAKVRSRSMVLKRVSFRPPFIVQCPCLSPRPSRYACAGAD